MLRFAILLSTVLNFAWLCNGQVVSTAELPGVSLWLSYQSGYVLDWYGPAKTTVSLYGPDAKLLYAIPNRGAQGSYFGWSADANGTTARAHRTYPNVQGEGRIDVLDVSGKVVRTINTGSYQPAHTTFGPDHTLWMVGYLGCDSLDDFNVVRHYALTGEKLGESLPWLQIMGRRNGCNSLQPVIGTIIMFSASDRIGFMSLGMAKWIEVGLDGKLLGQYDLAQYGGVFFFPRAMTASRNVYARIGEYKEFKGYAVLDRSNGMWRKVTGYPKGLLIGTDGDNLVFSQRGDDSTTLQKVASTAMLIQESDAAAVSTASAHK